MLRRGRIGEGWLGEAYAGEDVQGRLVRLIALTDLTADQRDWVLARHRFMTRYAVEGACPQLGIEFVNGTLYWVGGWRDGVQLSVILETKHLPNSVIMSIASGMIGSLWSAEQQGVSHGCLDPNGIWLGRDGRIWIDGYGEAFQQQTAQQDVYDVGRLVIEMFLGACPFPIEDPLEAKQALMTTGVELKALGLPGKLPRQILQMVLWNPAQRPTIEQVQRRWKISQGKEIISRWVSEHFGEDFSEPLPEDRIPTVNRIAPLPFPTSILEEEEHSIELPDIGLFQPTSVEVTSVIAALAGDDENTSVIEVEEVEQTEQLEAVPELDSEEASDEDTQAIAFFSEAEQAFFDIEETSRLTIEDPDTTGLNTEVDVDIDLASAMDIPPRRPWMGFVWIGVIGILLGGSLYWTIPSIPSVAEVENDGDAIDESLNDSEMLVDPVVLSSKSEALIEADTEKSDTAELEENLSEAERATEQVAAMTTPQQVSTSSPPRENLPEKAIEQPRASKGNSRSAKTVAVEPAPPPPPEPVQPASTVTKLEQKSTPKAAEQLVQTPEPETPSEVQEEIPVEDPVEPAPPPPPPKPVMGTVTLTGDAATVRLKKDGRDWMGAGERPPGTYEVYVTFEGFSEFKIGTLTVQEGREHSIKCNAMFATCKLK